jgi:predicted enzyme related to lactoylglutathione lyase
MTDTDAPTATRFGGATPILRVRDISASMEYYTRVLGFNNDWGIVDGFASISRDRCHLFLCEGDQGYPGAWVYIGVADVDALLEEYKTSGARIRHPPTNYDWACEMQVEDLDGNVLRIGSDPKKDAPVGEWLDMLGRRWIRSSEGQWTEVEEAQ